MKSKKKERERSNKSRSPEGLIFNGQIPDFMALPLLPYLRVLVCA